MTTEEIAWDALKSMLKGPIEQTKETAQLIRTPPDFIPRAC